MKKIAIIGGGASGMTSAVLLARAGEEVLLIERGDRLGRKLSATGNGQGNVTNLNAGPSHYFSDDRQKVAKILAAFPCDAALAFLRSLGGAYLPDERGRVYPAGRQASAVTDLFREQLSRLGVETALGEQICTLRASAGGFLLGGKREYRAEKVILAAGGSAAEHFGTDGSAYALARSFGHTVTELRPVLVPLKCDSAAVRGLKGVRVEGALTVLRGERALFSGRGDILFQDYGVSGDLVFRASSYAEKGDVLLLDLSPDLSAEDLERAAEGREGRDMLLGVLPNALARFVAAKGEKKRALSLVKGFPLTVTGTCGFSRAQATRGGIPLSETTDDLESKLQRGLYFTGEILDVDGECGGYNLHWAFASAHVACKGVIE